MRHTNAEETITKQGFWWLPKHPEHQVSGTLTYGNAEHAELKLLGTIQGDIEPFHILQDSSSYQPEVIQGRSTDGTHYTLFNSHRSGFNISAYVIESLSPAVVVEGRHFGAFDEAVLHQATLRLSHLSEWYQRTGRVVEHGEFDEGGMPALTLRFTRLPVTYASFGEGKICLGHNANVQFAQFGGDFVVSEEACVTIIPNTPRHLDDFLDSCIAPLIEFLSLAVGRSQSLLEIHAKAAVDCEGKSTEEVTRATSFRLFWKRRVDPRESKELLWHDIIFTAPQISARFDELLTAWWRTRAAIKPVLQMFFARVLPSGPISANTFLNAVQAAEAYHRYRRENREIPKDEHVKRLNEIYSAVPEEHRTWLERKLTNSHEKSLSQRLTELLDEHAALFTLSVEEIAGIAARIRDLRNFFTHYSGKKKGDFGTGSDFYLFGMLMQWLVIACLLEETGFGRDETHALLNDCQPFLFFRTHHLKKQRVHYFTVGEAPAPEVPKPGK